jgi:hypothetical protein
MAALDFGVIYEASTAPCGSNAFHAPSKRKLAIAARFSVVLPKSFVFFGWFSLAVFGVSLQILGRVGEL